MIFNEIYLKGAYLISLDKKEDDRGFFSRTFCEKEFRDMNLTDKFLQSNMSFNYTKGTLRGLHYQITPYEEDKLVMCIKGSIFDVIVDLRKNSETYGKHYYAILSESNYLSLYIPKGFAHGYQTLENDSTVLYQVSQVYNLESSRELRYNSQKLNISWPLDITSISEKDKNAPIFE
jgi:dTDP-4-dehydrorhamnose 3,5-epimerase